MAEHPSNFDLPKNIERYLGALSKLYERQGNRQLQEILVNGQVRVHEEWSRDNWNGGTYGHALYLTVPESLFLSCVKQKDSIQKQIREDLNAIHNVQNEFIEEVFLEMEIAGTEQWRRESGLFMVGKRQVPAEATKRIWGADGFRLFLSHKSEVKKETADLKNRLRLFGVTCFVAHEDIHPTKDWQDEIENALASMDAFAALMTEGFHDSDWTDQEVGFAVARRVPIIAVRLGKDPYGFIGKFQALRSSWDSAAQDILKVLMRQSRMADAFIQAMRQCSSYDDGNILAKFLPDIESLSTGQIEEMVAIYNHHADIRGSYGFNGTRPIHYGPGLVSCLNRLGSRQFRFAKSGDIEAVP